MENSEKKIFDSKRIPSWLKAAFVTLVFSIIGSAIYENIFRSSLSASWWAIVDLLSFGSSGLRDMIYSEAALDPSAISANHVESYMILGVIAFITYHLISPKLDKKMDELEEVKGKGLNELSLEELQAIQRKLKSYMKWTNRIRIVSLTVLSALVIIIYWMNITNSLSIDLWRKFNADLSIMAPSVSPQRISELRARFHLMTSKRDYDTLVEAMRWEAKNADVELRYH